MPSFANSNLISPEDPLPPSHSQVLVAEGVNMWLRSGLFLWPKWLEENYLLSFSSSHKYLVIEIQEQFCADRC